MSIKDFIKDQILLPKLQQKEVLVVYDPDKIYHDLCLEFDNGTIKVIDTSKSSIESRFNALNILKEIGERNSTTKNLLVYIPAKLPSLEEEKQKDPFALYAVCGSVFPDGDGDTYANICLKAKPAHKEELRKVFEENQLPSFDVIDAIDTGNSWPHLQVLLKKESAREILLSLLAPESKEEEALKKNDNWVSEAKSLFKSSIGLKLVTRSKNWSLISEELWRFILFSEFVFDLPENLPESLTNVTKADAEVRHIIEDLCNNIRNHRQKKKVYIARAEAIEKELDLSNRCKDIKNLGVIDTFPFEERYFLYQAVSFLKKNNLDAVRRILEDHRHSVWTGKGEIQIQWKVLESAMSVCELCEEYEYQYSQYSTDLNKLIDFYVQYLKDVDRCHREFEQNVGDDFEKNNLIEEVKDFVRQRYYSFTGKVHNTFIMYIESFGWPPDKGIYNASVFEKFVKPKLHESGYRIAYLLVDALRYELGVELEKHIDEYGQVNIYPAFAMLPTITSIGMASLLPQADTSLTIQKDQDNVVPMLNGQKLANVTQRMNILKGLYGDRFDHKALDEFIQSKEKIKKNVDLLVIRSTEIDKHLESDPENTLKLASYNTLKRIRVAIKELETQGFKEIVIAADHGFYLKTLIESGDVCSKPSGNWTNVHNRILLGDGKEDLANAVKQATHLGVKGSFNQVAFPKSLISYKSGEKYFHGGVSLQECIVPVITIKFTPQQQKIIAPTVNLYYKDGVKKVTTRLPVIDLELMASNLLYMHDDFELLVEAQDKNGNVVGEVKAGGVVNPATGTITLKPTYNDRIQIIIRMNPEFEGEFSVVAMDPKTLTIYSKIDLETDYVV